MQAGPKAAEPRRLRVVAVRTVFRLSSRSPDAGVGVRGCSAPREARTGSPVTAPVLPQFPLDSRVRCAGHSTPTKATPEGRRCTMPAAPRGVAGRPNPGSLRRPRKANSYHLSPPHLTSSRGHGWLAIVSAARL